MKACDRFVSEDQVKEMMDLLWVGELEREVVGVVGIKVTGIEVTIGPLAVSKNHQKLGIGGKLLDFGEGQGDISNVQVISLRTYLLTMYAKRGYREVKELPVNKVLPPHILTRTDLTVKFLQKK